MGFQVNSGGRGQAQSHLYIEVTVCSLALRRASSRRCVPGPRSNSGSGGGFHERVVSPTLGCSELPVWHGTLSAVWQNLFLQKVGFVWSVVMRPRMRAGASPAVEDEESVVPPQSWRTSRRASPRKDAPTAFP